MMPTTIRSRSTRLLEGPDRAPARSYFYAIGFTEDDLRKPLIGIANTWIEMMPCNSHLRDISEQVKIGVRAAGGTPVEFNTIAISDGITMGTEGMRTSLVSREIIADSIELVARGYLLDGIVAISGCDKTIPGTVMALARLDLPSLMVYGGSIMPGEFEGRPVTIQDVFEAVGAYHAGKISLESLRRLEHVACPGPGACGGEVSGDNMAVGLAVMGHLPMGGHQGAAVEPRKAVGRGAAGRPVNGL